jgi:hypothetical protein
MPEDCAAAGEYVEHDYLLGDPERVVPRQDDRTRPEQHVLCPCCDIGEQDDVVWAHGVVIEVMLDRPQAVEAEVVGKLGEPQLTLVHLLVRHVLVQVAESEVDSYVQHGSLLVLQPQAVMLPGVAA